MNKLRARIILSIGVLVVLFSLALLHRTHLIMASHVDELLQRKLELALEFELAVRQYIYEEIQPRMFELLSADDFIPEIMSSSYVARRVVERVQSGMPDIVVKFSAQNPRNPVNRASSKELETIAWFNEHPERDYWYGTISLDGREYAALFNAMRMTENCLRCHGDPADAPKKLIERYGADASFHLPLGRVVGMDTLLAPLDISKGIIAKDTLSHFSVLFIGIVCLFAGIVLVLRFSVTDHRIAQQALQTSEAKYRLIVENAPIGIFHYDEKGVITACNRYFADIIGVSVEDLIGFDTYRQQKNPDILKAMTESLAGRPSRFEGEYTSILSGKPTFANVVFVPFVGADGNIKGGIGVVEDIRERIDAEKELRISRENLRNLSRHLLSAREEEQMRIAREIHDELGQILSAVKMEFSWLKNRISKEQVQEQAKAGAVLELLDGGIDSVRRMISELRPALLTDLGLAPAMQWQAEKFAERSGISCAVDIAPGRMDIDDERATVIFRIFSEAVNNAVKHSGASEIQVRLARRDGGNIELTVIDNGVGITGEQVMRNDAYGIMGMKERVESYGGDLEISGTPGQGTVLVARIPAG
jgi:two-component system sensor histidine kinase UhpB